MDALKKLQQMPPLQKVFLFIAVATIFCSIFTDCILCRYWPLTMTAKLRNPFREHFDANATRLVAYTVNWCGFCREIKGNAWPKLEAAYKGTDVSVENIDAEEHADEAKAAGVSGYPTIVLYKDGAMKTYEGERTFEAIKAWVDAQ